jgi:hypothetical protein
MRQMMALLIVLIGNSAIPRQGSFFTKNSSSDTQPPPTRTITVLRRIRTKRNFCDSPNFWIQKSFTLNLIQN